MTAATGARVGFLGSVSLTRNVLANWLAMGVTIAATFFVTPIVVRVLQSERYGVWSFLNGLLAYSDLLYMGLGAALIKFVASHHAAGDQGGVNRVASAVLSIYTVIGLLCFVAFAGLSPFVPRFFARPLLTPDAEVAASIACVLLGVQLLVGFIGSAFAGVLYGLDRADLAGFMRVLTLTLRTVVIIAVLGGPRPLVTLAVITASAAALETLGLACLVFLVNRGLAVRVVKPTRSELKVLYGFGVQSFIVIFSMTLINYTDTTVIGVAIGAASVALYSLPLQLVEYIRVATHGVCGVLLPRLTVLAEKGDRNGLRSMYFTIVRVTMFLAAWLTANMVFLGGSFLTLWVGPEFGEQAQWIITCLSLAMMLHIFAITVPLGFHQAMGTLRVPAIVLLVEAIANLGLSLYLAPRLGILGVALGTLVPATIVGVAVLPPYLMRLLNVRLAEMVEAVRPSLVLLAGVGVLLWALDAVIGDTSYLHLAAKAFITAPLAGLVLVLMFPPEDREWVARRIRTLGTLRARLSALFAPRRVVPDQN